MFNSFATKWKSFSIEFQVAVEESPVRATSAVRNHWQCLPAGETLGRETGWKSRRASAAAIHFLAKPSQKSALIARSPRIEYSWLC